MGRRSRHGRRTSVQAAADRQADDLARDLGAALRQARLAQRMTQADAAAQAGIGASTWSDLEITRDGRTSLATLNRAAVAVGSSLRAYLAEVSAADQPRDAVHLRTQELVLVTARSGGWRGQAEVALDRDARTSRSADVVLRRRNDWALVEIWGWFADVGAAGRAWHRRLDALERLAIGRMVDDELPRVGGVWVVRATRRNRELLAAHRQFFESLLPGSAAAWLRTLASPATPMLAQAALLWVSVDGTRLFAPRRSVDRSRLLSSRG